jgi:redox-sensing transcriptional repressor
MPYMIANKKYVQRLSQYKNAVYRFKSLGFLKIFSDYLAEAVGVTSAQVRKDFSLFGICGNKRGGYQIDALIEKLNDILGKNELQKVIIVGAGSLGTALTKYKNFEKEGIKIEAAFDIDPSKLNARLPVPVLPIEKMDQFVRENRIKIAILCIPDVAAQQILENLSHAGVKGVLNFAPIQLKAPDACIINNVNLEVELENVIYFVNALEKSGLKQKPTPPSV